jgi:hypothetical protein
MRKGRQDDEGRKLKEGRVVERKEDHRRRRSRLLRHRHHPRHFRWHLYLEER